MKLENVLLPGKSPEPKDIEVIDGRVRSINPSQTPSGTPSLLLPSLCHPHIHLDKPYILTCNHSLSSSGSSPYPDYSDLVPRSGSFSEALQFTSKAKERFTEDDLYLRGSQLLADSCAHGVSSLRAFVEVDHVAQLKGLTTGLRLKRAFSPALRVQLCVFAQDPVFSSPHGDENRALVLRALDDAGDAVEALGATPYVEAGRDAALRNIEWAIETALQRNLHLDFHLDYTLEQPSSSAPPLVFSVVDLLIKHGWAETTSGRRTVALGHCTQLTLLPDAELAGLAARIAAAKLPIHFVGLPTSDIFMMGRPAPPAGAETEPASATTQSRPRGTLQVPSLIKDHGLSACLGVNNVGNAFTPYGTGDPLQLASWGVGLYHAGTPADAELLYGCVSWRARQAIGLAHEAGEAAEGGKDWRHGASVGGLEPVAEGTEWTPMLLVRNREAVEVPGTEIRVPARQRRSVTDVVWDPPDVSLRSIVR
ncbi:Amidohydrolase [Pleurostoma richardsiae]|uniref:Amidohydrolase n=1 Tax=Pleurostoma richardsiae TaxID=41990 RepID=A0AA38VCV4_9PEZI|nr:Amidohydrolase [Pleurostoma richardsiae]